MKTVKKNISSTKGSISAIVHYTEHRTDKLAILCPGYLDSKDYQHLVSLATVLIEKGYIVVRFDPTGTWESEGDIADYTTTQYLEDIRSILEYMLSAQSFKHILLGGHSRGGMISILYAARDPRISVVLGIMPSSGPIEGEWREEWEKAGVDIDQREVPYTRGKKEFCVPFSHVLDRDQYDVVEEVKKVNIPILLLAGELDNLVEPEDVKEIFDNANEPKKFIIIPGIGHDYRYSDKETTVVNQEILLQLGLMGL